MACRATHALDHDRTIAEHIVVSFEQLHGICAQGRGIRGPNPATSDAG